MDFMEVVKNNMKSFITKKIGKYELCLVGGWVGSEHKVLFIRDSKMNEVYDYGILPTDKANQLFNSIKDLPLELKEIL